MIGFLAKGLARDRSRSLFPVMVITLGVGVCVLMHAYMGGVMEMIYDSNARFSTGHVKIETTAAVKEGQQGMADLSLLGNEALLSQLETEAPEMTFYERIYLGALLDVPDEAGETKAQSTVMGIGVNLQGAHNEIENMKLAQSLATGRFPTAADEAMLSEQFLGNLGIQLGDAVTLIGSDMEGGMAVKNFKIVGTLRFGIKSLDRNAMILDIEGARDLLAMPDGATEIVGFYKDLHYFYHRAAPLRDQFNQIHQNPKDPYAPQMRILEEQNDLETMLSMYTVVLDVINLVFTFIMAIVLWNTGLMSGIRRYAEMGIRLAMGETKNHVYLSLLVEAFLVGLVGTVLGTLLGLAPALYMQEVGIDIRDMMTGEMSMIMEDRLTAMITTQTYLTGLMPGIAAPFLGALISGVAIFRRDTSRLFVELEV